MSESEVKIMNIPKKVRIGYKDYKINKIEGNLVDENKVCYGNIKFDEGDINISNLYSDDQQKCTFIHECVHGIDDIVETGLTEEQVRKLSKGIYQFIKDNPNIFTEDMSASNKLTTSVNIDVDKVIKQIENYMENELVNTAK